MIEKTIGGYYQIESKLGAGGFGTVYKGIDTPTQEIVAIKQLKPEIADAEQIERFKREGEALRELNHPNIVKLLDSVDAEDVHYLIMEYVDGVSLNEYIKNNELTTLDKYLLMEKILLVLSILLELHLTEL